MWLTHDTAGRPVDRDATVDVKFGDGEIFAGRPAFLWFWGPYRPDMPALGRIVEYRVRAA